eukprot:TRINITY_DN80359_c0_g1_i1.p1 TRINITY_DN80359_c0_g1~~TRINITY_DN80359_c0_g1_i1.p1  ORF type:complete len:813 (-),score=159.41 TRINITY_DN80359_c0_g1_i1:230-2611(-)
MSQARRGKAAGASSPTGKDATAPDVRPRSSTTSSTGEKPKSSAESGAQSPTGSALSGKPPGARPHLSSSSSFGNGASPKHKAMMAMPKTPVNIAALAARNLGGFVPNKIFVGGVPITCTEESFKAYFEPYGGIARVELHALRGFGYITYDSVESVDACLEKYEDHYLSKKWVEVKRSIPRELIESYERERRRLTEEFAAHKDGEHAVTAAKATIPGMPPPPSQSPTVPPASRPAAGRSPTSSLHQPGPPPAVAAAPPPARKPAGAPPSAGAWGGSPGGKGSGKGDASRIKQLTDMGFPESVAKRVLSECVWDVNKAIDRLLTDESLMADVASADAGSAGDGGAFGGAGQDGGADERGNEPEVKEEPAPAPVEEKKSEGPSVDEAAAEAAAAAAAAATAVVPKASPPTPTTKASASPKAALAGSTSPSKATAPSGASPTSGSVWGKAPSPAAQRPPMWGKGDPALPSSGGSAWGKSPKASVWGKPAGYPSEGKGSPAAKTSAWGKGGASAQLPKAAAEASPAEAAEKDRSNGAPTTEERPATAAAAVPAASHKAAAAMSAHAEDRSSAAMQQEPQPAVAPHAAAVPAATSFAAAAAAAAQQSPPQHQSRATDAKTSARPIKQEEPPQPKAEVVQQAVAATPAAQTPAAAPASEGAAAEVRTPQPKKRIERVSRHWNGEDPSQLSVSENEYICVWVDTATEHGWIHAERRSNPTQVGWLPCCVLQQLPDGQRWMVAKQHWQAMDDSQCMLEVGMLVVVWVTSRTAEGWTYAEAPVPSGGLKPGWLPDFCLEWNED